MEGEIPEVASAIVELYGAQPLIVRGVVHVTSAVRADDGRLHVIRIGEHAPKSERDFFALNLCRARCDAILTTANNLRAEPRLQHGLQGRFAPALIRYRREQAKKTQAPCCAIMTRSGDLPLDHRAFSDGTPKLVLTTREAAPALRARLPREVEVVALAGLDARVACAFLHARGFSLISVEAGPSTNRALYDAPSPVDELLLSLYEEPIASTLLGHPLADDAALFRDRSLVYACTQREASGRWSFQRWQRDPLSR